MEKAARWGNKLRTVLKRPKRTADGPSVMSTPTLTPDSRLLELLWTGKPPGCTPAAPPPATEADWQRVLALATRHSLAPLLAAELLNRTDLALPGSVRTQLTAIRERAARRALSQIAELLRVLAAFQREGIPAMTFKGQLLAEQAYGDVSLRSCFDLDIFVPETEVLRAKQVLQQLDYLPKHKLLPHQEADLLLIECEYPFNHRQTGCRIDLQWRPRARYFSFPLPARELWDRSVTTTLVGHPVRTFAIEDLILLLAVHGAKHAWRRLEQVSGFAGLLLRHSDVSWAVVEQRAHDRGAHRMLLLARHLVSVWFPSPSLPEKKSPKEDPEVAALGKEVASDWFSPEPVSASVISTLHLHLRMRERLSDQIRHCFWLAVTPGIQDWQKFHLPPALHPLHYCLRPVGLLKRFTARLQQEER